MTYDHDNTNDYDNDLAYDSSVDDLTDEEAIAELMEEGYSEEEARRMLGEYDYDEKYYDHDDDIPDMDDFDPRDLIDEEDFD